MPMYFDTFGIQASKPSWFGSARPNRTGFFGAGWSTFEEWSSGVAVRDW